MSSTSKGDGLLTASIAILLRTGDGNVAFLQSVFAIANFCHPPRPAYARTIDHRIALWGATLGFTAMRVLAVIDETVPMAWDTETVRYVLVRALIGMAGGSAVFGGVSILRNAVLGAE